MKRVKIALIFLSLSIPMMFAYSSSTELSVMRDQEKEALAKETINEFYDAAALGDVEKIQALLSGAYAKRIRSTIEYPGYDQTLKKYYGSVAVEEMDVTLDSISRATVRSKTISPVHGVEQVFWTLELQASTEAFQYFIVDMRTTETPL